METTTEVKGHDLSSRVVLTAPLLQETPQFEAVLRKVIGVAASEHGDEINAVCVAAAADDESTLVETICFLPQESTLPGELRNSVSVLLYCLVDNYSSASNGDDLFAGDR